MDVMDQLFPANHKTLFLLDHTPYFELHSNAHVTLDFNRGGLPPVRAFKSMWTCAVESAVEYCRIVWDLFPGTKFVRLIGGDTRPRDLNTWASAHQDLDHLLRQLSALGPPDKLMPDPDGVYSVVYAFGAAVEAMSECTAVQLDKRSKENGIEVRNKCRTIIITSARDNTSIDNLMKMFHDEINKVNKYASAPGFMSIQHCHLVIINTYPDTIICEVTDRTLYSISPTLDLEVYSIPASKLGSKVENLLMKHYNLASTTVTGIPMKEEQNASSSANYDVEIYHEATAHATILNANVDDTRAVVEKKKGADYETIKLKWNTPKANNNLPDIYNCTTLHRITPVDINTRPSACLVTFLLNGRSVLLEMDKKGGGKSIISHVLKSHNGQIYIHTVPLGRSILDGAPSIREGPGGKVNCYRVADFGAFMRQNLLQPMKQNQTEGKNCIEEAKEKLKRQTAYWPLIKSSTIIFIIKQYTEPMLSLMVKDNLNDEEVRKCYRCICSLITAESENKHLIAPSTSNSKKIMKKEEQYKLLWTELETFLKSNLYTENHCRVLQYLFECRGVPDTEKIVEKTLMHFKKSFAERPSVIRATTDSPMSPPLSQQSGIELVHNNQDPNGGVNYLNMIQNLEINKAKTATRPQFAGRAKAIKLKNGNLFTKLYQKTDDDLDDKSGK